MFKLIKQNCLRYPITLVATLTLMLSACTSQSWYESAKSAQTNHCKKGPSSEFEDCNQPATKSYIEYEKDLEELKEENGTDG